MKLGEGGFADAELDMSDVVITTVYLASAENFSEMKAFMDEHSPKKRLSSATRKRKGRTAKLLYYRTAKLLYYRFGYGLSYTKFEYYGVNNPAPRAQGVRLL